ncbi:MAG: hypothetical protein FWF27_02945 [Candidatus Bathyarchaeota archaeon]|nr:hypothetical protein [Candidatus Termiticorpusculum sp.]
MPHRKTPLEYACKLLYQNDHYDQEIKEHINRLSPQVFRVKIKEKYPTINVDKIIQHLPSNSLIDGLVLDDTRGCGVLQQIGVVPENTTCEEWNEQMYLSTIHNKNKHKHTINNNYNNAKRRRVF